MKVDGSVDVTPCRRTVDTEAERTLAQASVVANQLLPSAQQRLRGVTGHSVSLKEPVEACIGLGNMQERLSVYVANVEEPCLLGLDYFQQGEAACVYLGRKSLKVCGE